ncbi:MAG: MBL fold metallo-hydrolase [Deltaproteobacteria bacterium]|nr:MBL fold metallo-hydrolase [Deltaproteobacteria bacterium]
MIFETIVVGPLQVNCYLVGCEQSRMAAVVDPGDEVERILDGLKKFNLKAACIINTHEHFDHVGGNKRLHDATGAEIMAHRASAEEITKISSRALLWGMRAEDSPPVDRLLDDGDIVNIGESVSLKVLSTPGHSLGSISLAGEGFAIVGDLIFAGSIGRTDFPGGDYETLIRSVREKIFPLGDDVVLYSGHGPATTVGRERATNPFFAA